MVYGVTKSQTRLKQLSMPIRENNLKKNICVCVCVCVSESLRYTPEITTTL